jgi:hypothetical protein
MYSVCEQNYKLIYLPCIYRMAYPSTLKNIFPSGAHRVFSKTNHTLEYQTTLFKDKIKIT